MPNGLLGTCRRRRDHGWQGPLQVVNFVFCIHLGATNRRARQQCHGSGPLQNSFHSLNHLRSFSAGFYTETTDVTMQLLSALYVSSFPAARATKGLRTNFERT